MKKTELISLLENKGYEKVTTDIVGGYIVNYVKDNYEIFFYRNDNNQHFENTMENIKESFDAIEFILNNKEKAQEITDNFDPVDSTSFEEKVMSYVMLNS